MYSFCTPNPSLSRVKKFSNFNIYFSIQVIDYCRRRLFESCPDDRLVLWGKLELLEEVFRGAVVMLWEKIFELSNIQIIWERIFLSARIFEGVHFVDPEYLRQTVFENQRIWAWFFLGSAREYHHGERGLKGGETPPHGKIRNDVCCTSGFWNIGLSEHLPTCTDGVRPHLSLTILQVLFKRSEAYPFLQNA